MPDKGGKAVGSDNVLSMPKQALRAASVLLDRVQLAWRAGIGFEGQRDYYEIFGWKRVLTHADFRAKYQRQDVARAIIDRPADAVWSDPPKVKINDEPSEEWDELVIKFSLWNIFERADRLTALGQYSILLLGLDDGAALERPVNIGTKTELLYVQPHGQWNATIRTVESDTSSSRFGLPSVYDLQLPDLTAVGKTGTASRPALPIQIDWTRVIHSIDNPLDDNVFGVPRLESVFNVLDDLMKVTGGTAEAFWLEGRGGLQVDVDKEMDLQQEDADDLEDEFTKYYHNLSRFLRTRGVTTTQLGGKVPDPSGTFKVLVSLLSAATGIPQRILLGSEAGALASTQDRANWAERIVERQRTFAEPNLLRPFIERLQLFKILPEGTVTVEWPSAFKQNPLEEGQAWAQFARAIVNASRQAEKGFPIASLEEIRERFGLPREIPAGDTIPVPLVPEPAAPPSEEDE